MKKIIKHGIQHDIKTICPSCGCEFTYNTEDIISIPNITWKNTYYTWNTSYSYVTCPECGTTIYVYNQPKQNPYITWTCSYEVYNHESKN